MRCLVVDDSSVIRSVAGSILEDLGFEVAEAEDGDKAIAMCRAQMPDLILLDWLMPGIGGHGVLVQLRALIKERKPFVVYCTSENDAADFALARRQGADEILLKPFDRQSLAASVAGVAVEGVARAGT